MASYNSVTLVGNMGQDPKIKTIGENKVAEFSLATSQGRRGENETTDWHRIVAWSPRAEIIEQYTGKGSRLLVRGSIRYRKYQDKDGDDRQVTEIVAQEILLLSNCGEGQQRQDYTPSGAPAPRSKSQIPAGIPAAPSPRQSMFRPAQAPASQPAEQEQPPLFNPDGSFNNIYDPGDDMPEF